MTPEGIQALRGRFAGTRHLLIGLEGEVDAEVLACGLALREALGGAGRTVALTGLEGLPRSLRELFASLDLEIPSDPLEGAFDLSLSLGGGRALEASWEGGSLELFGGCLPEGSFAGARTLGEGVFDLLEDLGCGFHGPVAKALYVAISWATDSFQNELVTAATHSRVAHLLESGIPADLLARRLFREDSLAFLRLLGKVLAQLEVALDGRVVLGSVSREDLREFACESDLAHRLAGRVDQVRKSELVVLFLEQEDGAFQTVLRSRRLPAHRIAALFGGRGEARQARFLLTLPRAEATSRVLEALAAPDF